MSERVVSRIDLIKFANNDKTNRWPHFNSEAERDAKRLVPTPDLTSAHQCLL